MGRSFRPIVPVAAVVFALLVVVPPPLAMSAGARSRPSSRVGPGGSSNSVKRGAKIIDKLLKKFTEKGRKELVDKSADSAPLFVFNLTVGTSSPPQNIPGVLDINSQLVWSQCSPCSPCLPAPAPAFEPDRSSTFARLPCGSQTCQKVLNDTCSGNAAGDDRCNYTYMSESTNTTGYLANDTFTFGDTPVPGLVFGCSDAFLQGNLSGASGSFGLSRNPLSLVSQLQLSWFSYFLASDDDESDDSSRIQFGGDAAPPQTKNSRSTPLLNSTLYPDLYSVKLTGVRVDGNDLAADIPAGTFDFQANGSGGVFLSTTNPLTVLEQAAYDAVRKAIAGSITAAQPVDGSAIGLDLCYTMQSLKSVTIPKLALVFDGDDAVMDLKRYNYLFADNDTGLECLSIMPYTGLSLLGSLVQTGIEMTYDIDNARLIFDTTAAQTTAAASPAAHSLATMMLLYHLAVWVVLF
ncbi:aspartic proteinase nepenthesin-2-like [Miscanthus floridulus]|uniref:aspartic proteinase nepenthesin-2-like n=1 Tax=Miscanthus floridulus TaxID=154761 RepID=UPI003457BE17